MATATFEKKTCPCCGHVSKRYKVTFSTLHIRLAKMLFQYCTENKTNIVETGAIGKYMNHSDYGNF